MSKADATRMNVDSRLSIAASIGYGAQHVMAMYGGIIAPPLIIGSAAGFDLAAIAGLVTASLLLSGVATIFQTLRAGPFGSGLPVVQGVSFTGVSTMALIASERGIQVLYGAIIVAGVVGFVLTPLFGRLMRFFPPVVAGTIILVVGLSLMPVAFNWVMGTEGEENYGAMENVIVAFASVAIVLTLNHVFQGGVIARLSILLGLVLGTVVAIPFGMVDFSAVSDGPVVALPEIFPGGHPILDIGTIATLLIVVIVNMVETGTAGILAVGNVVGVEPTAKRMTGGLRVDMAATAAGPVFGVMPLSVFAQNVGVVAVTKVYSRYVVAYGGGILVLLGLLPILGRVVASVPTPVLGGVGMVLFGMVASSGIGLLRDVNTNSERNLLIISLGVAVGLIPEMVPAFWSTLPAWLELTFQSGVCVTTLVTVGLNAIMKEPASEPLPESGARSIE